MDRNKTERVEGCDCRSQDKNDILRGQVYAVCEILISPDVHVGFSCLLGIIKNSE